MNPDRAGMSLNPYERYAAWCRMLSWPALSEEAYDRLLREISEKVIGQERLQGRARRG